MGQLAGRAAQLPRPARAPGTQLLELRGARLDLHVGARQLLRCRQPLALDPALQLLPLLLQLGLGGSALRRELGLRSADLFLQGMPLCLHCLLTLSSQACDLVLIPALLAPHFQQELLFGFSGLCLQTSYLAFNGSLLPLGSCCLLQPSRDLRFRVSLGGTQEAQALLQRMQLRSELQVRAGVLLLPLLARRFQLAARSNQGPQKGSPVLLQLCMLVQAFQGRAEPLCLLALSV
mmetsp:Transcript_85592/g.237232  ORF Transcript_85592/g.237232 Transcript_85592/m.237232 type:complete len:234 (+) Transcript_85592:435-1136(+)